MRSSHVTSAKPNRLLSLLKRRWQFLALIAVIFFFPLTIKSFFIMRLGIILALYAISVTGMTLLTRFAGVVSLGHSAFFALGAYISALLTVRLGLNPWLAMVCVAGLSIVCAYLFSVPFLKLRGVYLAMGTLGLGEVAFLLSKDLTITGGVNGIAGIPHLSIAGIELSQDWQLFYLFGCFVIFLVYMAENIGRTRLGRAYRAIQTNETAAMAMGIDVQRELGKLFAFSALVCALAGSLLAHFITFISPESFTVDFSLALLIIVIIGGANIWGTLIITIVLVGFSEVFRGLQDMSMGFYGILLIVSLFAFPDGLGALFFKKGRGASRTSLAPETVGQLPEPPWRASGAVDETAPGARTIMTLSNISKKFGGTEALSKVSFSIERNQIVGIIGPNGAGKTTLLNVINGFLPPLEGTITFRNMDITQRSPHQRAVVGMGRTFQLVHLFKGMSVLENVMVGLHLGGRSGIFMGGLNLGRPRAEEEAILGGALEKLEFLGLMDRANDLVESLSFGEQRLLELARALAMEPQLLLLDEPAAGLNTAETERLGDILRRIRDRGVTIILVEHNMPLVMSLSDMIYVLNFGKGICFGTPEEVTSHDEVIRAYLGQEARRAS